MRAVLLSYALTFALQNAAQASIQTIGFDGVGNSSFSGSATESGLTYSLYSGALFGRVFSGSQSPEIHGDPVRGGGVLSVFSSDPAVLLSVLSLDIAELDELGASAPNDIVLQGFLNGVVVGTEVFSPNQALGSANGDLFSAYRTVMPESSLDGAVLDEIRVTLPGGVIMGSSTAYARLDNLVVEVFGGDVLVPEPGSWTLWWLSVVAAGVVRGGRTTRRPRTTVREIGSTRRR